MFNVSKRLTLWEFLSLMTNDKVNIDLRAHVSICGINMGKQIGKYTFEKSSGCFIEVDPKMENPQLDRIDSRSLIVESFQLGCKQGTLSECELIINVKDKFDFRDTQEAVR